MAKPVKITLAPDFGVKPAMAKLSPGEPSESKVEEEVFLSEEEKREVQVTIRTLAKECSFTIDALQRRCNHLRSNMIYSLGRKGAKVSEADAIFFASLIGLRLEDLKLGEAIHARLDLIGLVKDAASENDLLNKPTNRYRHSKV